jgi:hypothetical protein
VAEQEFDRLQIPAVLPADLGAGGGGRGPSAPPLTRSFFLYAIFALQNLLCLEVTPSRRHGAGGYARGEIRSAIALWHVRRNRRNARPEKLETAEAAPPRAAPRLVVRRSGWGEGDSSRNSPLQTGSSGSVSPRAKVPAG